MSSVRTPFGNQKLVYILIRYTGDYAKTLRYIYEGLREVITIAAGVSGGIRIPGIGVGILQNPFLQVFPLSRVRGCLDTILPQLEKLTSLSPDHIEDNDEILFNLAMPFIEKNLQEFSPNEKIKLKLLLFTWEDVDPLMKAVASYFMHYPLLRLASVKVHRMIEILNEVNTNLVEEPREVGEPLEASAGIHVIGEMLQADPFSLRMVFKEWLVEDGSQIPHMVLTVHQDPAKRSLYFDIRESSVDPNHLPSGIASKLSLPSAGIRTTPTNTGSFVPVIVCEGIRLFAISSLSASWHSGLLAYLVPSVAEKLSFEDFWDNSQRVGALRDYLLTKEAALLCRITSSGASPIHAHFLILPFSEGLALIQVVPPELALTEALPPFSSDIPRKFRAQIEDVMRNLEVTNFSVEHLDSNLSPSIVTHFSRTPRGTAKSHNNPASHIVRPQVRRGTGYSRGIPRGSMTHPCF